MIGNGHMCKHFNVWTSTRRNKGMKSHLTYQIIMIYNQTKWLIAVAI